MTVELFGGPLDGALVEDVPPSQRYLVLDSHDDSPVYAARLSASTRLRYFFVGYESAISIAFPQVATRAF